MGAHENVTWQKLVEELLTRFGSAEQTNLYRMKWSNYRQAPRETLAAVAQEVRRLIVLAYPCPTNEVLQSLARDAFIRALADKEIAQELWEREPKDIEAAYKDAVRLEGYRQLGESY